MLVKEQHEGKPTVNCTSVHQQFISYFHYPCEQMDTHMDTTISTSTINFVNGDHYTRPYSVISVLTNRSCRLLWAVITVCAPVLIADCIAIIIIIFYGCLSLSVASRHINLCWSVKNAGIIRIHWHGSFWHSFYLGLAESSWLAFIIHCTSEMISCMMWCWRLYMCVGWEQCVWLGNCIMLVAWVFPLPLASPSGAGQLATRKSLYLWLLH